LSTLPLRALRCSLRSSKESTCPSAAHQRTARLGHQGGFYVLSSPSSPTRHLQAREEKEHTLHHVCVLLLSYVPYRQVRSQLPASFSTPPVQAREVKKKHTLHHVCVLFLSHVPYRLVRSPLPASLYARTCRRNRSQHTRIMRVMRVTSYRSAKSWLPAQPCLGLTPATPRSAICVQASSRRARNPGASALHVERMQMLQINVYKEPIPARLLLRPPLHTYCGTCMEIRFVTLV
jgi:hypothetical protein